MPIKFAVKIVRVKVYMTGASPMTLTFTQGPRCISKLIYCLNLQYLGQYLSYYIKTWHICMAYIMLMLVLMNLTLKMLVRLVLVFFAPLSVCSISMFP